MLSVSIFFSYYPLCGPQPTLRGRKGLGRVMRWVGGGGGWGGEAAVPSIFFYFFFCNVFCCHFSFFFFSNGIFLQRQLVEFPEELAFPL